MTLSGFGADPRGNVPAPISPFIGRLDAIETVTRLVLGNRLVTLTGSGGAGKTRLAQEVAPGVATAFPDGVFWVELVGQRDPLLVAATISEAAVLPTDADDELGGLARRLGSRGALLVLDNCEHLLDAVAEAVEAVLSACPNMKVLATSRSALNVPGELAWRVPPMALDDAVQLFVDRATKVDSGFELRTDNAAHVQEICARLDGVPLAIELAAARSRVLTVAQIRSGLRDAIALLTTAQRGVLPRQQAIAASIRWSYDLLSDAEQRAFRRLAVFAAPFTLEAATAVLVDTDLAAAGVLEVLERLAEQSLVTLVTTGGDARFRMLETVRQFAAHELDAAGETDAIAERHAAYFAARALRLWPLFEPNMIGLLNDEDAEHADLVAMLAHVETHASPERHAEIAMACLPAMGVRRVSEAGVLGDRAADRVGEGTALCGHLHLQLALVDPRTQPRRVQIALAAAESSGEELLQAMGEYWKSSMAFDDPTPAVFERYEATRQRLDALGEGHFSRTYWCAAAAMRAIGRHSDAAHMWELARQRTVCKRCSVMVWSERARIAMALGDLASAKAAFATAQTLAVEVRDEAFLSHTRLIETEVSAYEGAPCPSDAIAEDLRAAASPMNPMTLGFLSEARGLAKLVEGDLLGADADFAAGIENAEIFSKRTEARLRRAAISHARGEYAVARATLAELRSDAARWESGPWLLSQIDHRAAALALDEGHTSEADDLAHSALSDAWLGPFPPLMVAALELLVSIAVARESYTEAARLFGAAGAQRDEIGYRLDLEPERRRLAADVGSLRNALGASERDEAITQGRHLSLNEAVAYARRARGERKRPSHGWDGLTPTELRVAELAVQGLTNAQIAERLFVGRETIKTHLSNVYAKVGVATRAQLVVDAARRGIS